MLIVSKECPAGCELVINVDKLESVFDFIFYSLMVATGIVLAIIVIGVIDEFLHENRDSIWVGGCLSAVVALLTFLHYHH